MCTYVALVTHLVSFISAQVILRTDDMDLAGDVIQSMTEFLGIEVRWTAIQC